MPTFARPVLKMVVFILIFTMAASSAAADDGTCLWVEHSYYNYLFFDPIKGTSRAYTIEGIDLTDVQDYSARSSPDGRYLLWWIVRNEGQHFSTQFIVTKNTLDRRPLLQIDVGEISEQMQIEWLPGNERLLFVTHPLGVTNITNFKLVDLNGRSIEKETRTSRLPLTYFETASQDSARLIVFLNDEQEKNRHYEIWSARDLSLLGSFSLPDDVISDSYYEIPMIVWRPGADEFAYLRKTANRLLVAFAAPFEPSAFNLMIPVSDKEFFNTDHYEVWPDLQWSPDGKFLSILINHAGDWHTSTLYIVDARTKPYQLHSEISARVARPDCNNCAGPRVRWQEDGKAIHYLERPLIRDKYQVSLQNALVAYYPAEQRNLTISKDIWSPASADNSETLLLVEHYLNSTTPPKIDFSAEYAAIDGSFTWTALHADEYLELQKSPDFRKIAGYSMEQKHSVGLLWANLDTRQSYQVQFGGKTVRGGNWSSDSHLFAFKVVNPASKTIDLGIADATTGGYRIVAPNITADEYAQLQVTVNGQIFVEDDKPNSKIKQIRLFDADGKEIPFSLPPDIALDPIIRLSSDGNDWAVFENIHSYQTSLLMMRKDGTIVREFKSLSRINYDSNFVWIPCDQPLQGWQPRAPLDFPRWP